MDNENMKLWRWFTEMKRDNTYLHMENFKFKVVKFQGTIEENFPTYNRKEKVNHKGFEFLMIQPDRDLDYYLFFSDVAMKGLK